MDVDDPNEDSKEAQPTAEFRFMMTVQQPHCHLIAKKYKTIENRNTPLNKKYCDSGPEHKWVALHCSTKLSDNFWRIMPRVIPEELKYEEDYLQSMKDQQGKIIAFIKLECDDNNNNNNTDKIIEWRKHHQYSSDYRNIPYQTAHHYKITHIIALKARDYIEVTGVQPPIMDCHKSQRYRDIKPKIDSIMNRYINQNHAIEMVRQKRAVLPLYKNLNNNHNEQADDNRNHNHNDGDDIKSHEYLPKELKSLADHELDQYERRLRWKRGFKVSIFSISMKEWRQGIIQNIIYDEKNIKEELHVCYEGEDDWREKIIERFHKHIEPIQNEEFEKRERWREGSYCIVKNNQVRGTILQRVLKNEKEDEVPTTTERLIIKYTDTSGCVTIETHRYSKDIVPYQ